MQATLEQRLDRIDSRLETIEEHLRRINPSGLTPP